MATRACWSRAVQPDCWDGPKLGLAAGLKDLDGDHTPAAARTSVPLFVVVTPFSAIARIGRRGWLGHAEELAGHCDIGGPVGIGEEAVMTDAVEPVGQYVDQEAADELVGVERHQLVAGVAPGPVILPLESHALAVEGDEPAVGNGDPVGVADR